MISRTFDGSCSWQTIAAIINSQWHLTVNQNSRDLAKIDNHKWTYAWA